MEKRGWTLDVLNVVQLLDSECRPEGTALHEEEPELGRAEASPLHKTFSLADVYARADELARLHPANRHVREKIRQQLQVLRDMGLVEFLGSGVFRLG